jgi:hypothetical protein
MCKTVLINIPAQICYLRKQMDIAKSKANTDLYYNLLSDVMELLQEQTNLLVKQAIKQHLELKLILNQDKYIDHLSIVK